MSSKVSFFCDGSEISVPAGRSVLEAAQLAGIKIPYFCQGELASAEGRGRAVLQKNLCGFCVVEVEGDAGLSLACHLPVRAGLRVQTDSATIRQEHERILKAKLEGQEFSQGGASRD